MRKESMVSASVRRMRDIAATLVAGLGLAGAAAGQTPVVSAPSLAGKLPRDAAVHYALENNGYLRTVRTQHGYAEAAIIIGKTYPFNPVYTGYVTYAGGPQNAAVENHVYQEHYISLEIELRGQKHHRQAVAAAAASRIDLDISQQELVVTMAVIRAYNTVLYRQNKLAFLDEGIKVNEMQFEQIRKQADAGKVKANDLVLARADLEASRAQRGPARIGMVVARSELRKLLGTLDDSFVVQGDLEVPLPATDATALTRHALDERPDLRARRSAICEAEAALRLVVANRFGNPSFGPYYEFDPTRISYVGARISTPLAVFNSKKAEIRKAETDVAKIHSEVQQLELQASQEVQAALARLADAGKWAAAHQDTVLPDLRKAKGEMENLFAKGDPGVDFGKLLVVNRSYLKSSESLLDARYEISQAQVDLALAVAEPALALGPGAAPPR